MPIEYPASSGGGVLNEHRAVRESVGLFDVSHLGKASVKGIGALDFLNTQVTNDLNRITAGQAQYSLLCNEMGGVIDDVIIYCRSEDDLLVIPNAANAQAVLNVLVAQNHDSKLLIKNRHLDFAVIALQGPLSKEVLKSIGLQRDLDYMSFTNVDFEGASFTLCRTGYSGEHGYELIPPTAKAIDLWNVLSREVLRIGGKIAGLGARDTLRTEMGYPLHGHELSLEITPVEASASWAVGWAKDEFIGSETLRSQKQNGASRKSFALKSLDRGIPRAGMVVKNQNGQTVGEITSGTFSPTLKIGIGIALLDSNIQVGDTLVIDVRGRDSQCEVVKLPFVTSHVR